MSSATELSVAQSGSPRHTTGTRLVLNTVTNFAAQALIVALTFFATPYITRKLGAAQYGALALLMTYLYMFSLLNLGINTSLVKYLAGLMPQNRLGDMQAFLETSFTMLVGMGVVIGMAIFWGADPIVRHFFKGPQETLGGVTLALRIASISFILQFLSQVLSAIPAAAQRFDVLNLVRGSSEAMRIGGSVIVLYFGGGLPELLAVVMAISLLTCFAYAISARRLVPQLSLRAGFSRSHFRSLLNHSKFVLTGNLSTHIVGVSDNMMIGYFLPVSALAYYSVAYTLGERMWALVGNVASVVFPAASAFSATNQGEHVQELYVRGAKSAAAAACFPAFALALFSRQFLWHWLGPDYATQGALVLSLLSIGFLINSLIIVPYQTLQSTHYASTTAKGSAIYAVINLTLFFVLIPRFGIVGAAAGFFCGQVLYVPCFVHRANRLLGVKWSELLTKAYLPVLGVALLACGVTWLFRPWIHSLFSLGLAVGVGLTVYGIVTYMAVLDDKERSACRELLQRVLRTGDGVRPAEVG